MSVVSTIILRHHNLPGSKTQVRIKRPRRTFENWLLGTPYLRPNGRAAEGGVGVRGDWWCHVSSAPWAMDDSPAHDQQSAAHAVGPNGRAAKGGVGFR